jgi:pSer/pThr/pTyr-binding forkhead associated (FHA) protein
MPRLYALGGRDAGRSFEVADGAVLGRAQGCEVRLADLSVSRRHAELREEAGRWVLIDLGSRNGLRKAGTALLRVELVDHDEVMVGEVPLRFRLVADSEAPEVDGSIEFVGGGPPRAAPPLAPSAARPDERAAMLAADAAGPGELELEEEIVLGPTAVRPRPVIADLTPRERERARILRGAEEGGLFTGDLAQRPPWIRALVYGLAIALGAGLFWGAFELVRYLRGTL